MVNSRGSLLAPACRPSHRALSVCVLVAFLIAALLGLAASAASLQLPYQLDYGEGPLLNHAYRLAQGVQIYTRGLRDYPYLVVNYPPVYIYVYSCLGRMFGWSLGVGRAISLGASLAVALSLGAIVYASAGTASLQGWRRWPSWGIPTS